MKELALFLVLIPGVAFAKTATSSLESKAVAAFSDISKARTALGQGNDKTGDSWLTKAKTLLSSVLQQNQTGSQIAEQPNTQQRTGQEQAQQQPSTQQQTGQEPAQQQQSPSALSRAETEAQKLDPSIAGKLGAPAQGQTPTASSNPLGAISDLKSVYDNVSLAQSLLHKGDSTQAKSILDKIPTSPADALQLLHR